MFGRRLSKLSRCDMEHRLHQMLGPLARLFLLALSSARTSWRSVFVWFLQGTRARLSRRLGPEQGDGVMLS